MAKGDPVYTITGAQRALSDEQESLSFGHTQWTFPSHYPMVRFDHLFVSPDLGVESLQIPQTKLTRVASDHLPLVVKLRVKRKAG